MVLIHEPASKGLATIDGKSTQNLGLAYFVSSRLQQKFFHLDQQTKNTEKQMCELEGTENPVTDFQSEILRKIPEAEFQVEWLEGWSRVKVFICVDDLAGEQGKNARLIADQFRDRLTQVSVEPVLWLKSAFRDEPS